MTPQHSLEKQNSLTGAAHPSDRPPARSLARLPSHPSIRLSARPPARPPIRKTKNSVMFDVARIPQTLVIKYVWLQTQKLCESDKNSKNLLLNPIISRNQTFYPKL